MKPGKNHIQPPTRRERRVIRTLLFLGVLSVAHFLYWFLQPAFRGHPLLYGMLCAVFGYGMLRHFYLWYHYAAIRIPSPPRKRRAFTVDILTTYFPGEPREMVEDTLRAIQDIPYPHTAYLCDEANDPSLKSLCRELGVVHVTRNTRKDAKAGNINNALRQATGELCLVLDPDHKPLPDILDHIVPHFADDRTGFVQIVQSYSNKKNSLVARGAAEQTYQFYGPMMMSMNAYGTVNAIGANCTFRRKALDSIGGHAPGLAEDMHTAMRLYAKGWKSVYIPKVLARGLVPETLLTHFKQQLKWSRGTFELLFRVYPKLFRQFTWRQKIHFGLLPLHFLVGVIYLLSFCIPVISLLFSISPWTGNILLFLLAILPVALSTLLIRAYIQKWVIEPEERGFHWMGGLLQIATWWIHFLGFLYALTGKKVPYLPTDKMEKQKTNLRIIIPNLLVGLASVFSITYGLYRDLTPFSVMMAGFAGLNAVFMFFSIYLATGVTNQNRFLRDRFPGFTRYLGRPLGNAYRNMGRFVFTWTRRAALPLLLSGALLTAYSLDRYLYHQWEGIIPLVPQQRKGPDYTGIFYPSGPDGLTDMESVARVEQDLQQGFDLISFYLAWGEGPSNRLPEALIQEIYDSGSWPMITWEPWTASFRENESLPDLKENQHVFDHIISGIFDDYIDAFARDLKNLEEPVFLRFAHEFDNPRYPWSQTGENQPEDFIQAWRYVYDRFDAVGAQNVIWIWNPFTNEKLTDYFPGEAYVDWIGVTLLNFGSQNADGVWHSFYELYKPFHDAFNNELPDLPVMVAEFGSLDLGGDRRQWLAEAADHASLYFGEIKAWVFFFSKWDRNIPKPSSYAGTYLDWTHDPGWFRELLPKIGHGKCWTVAVPEQPGKKGIYTPMDLPKKPIRGVQYKKGLDWFGSHYTLDRTTLMRDFGEMVDAGINTVRIEGPSIYDHNLLSISKAKGLDLIYSFWLPERMDFLRDSQELTRLENRILRTVHRYKNEGHITAWNLGNPVWSKLTQVYQRPELERQRTAFLHWFGKLCYKIKQQDPNRLLFADFIPTLGYSEFTEFLQSSHVPLDALGLIVPDPSDKALLWEYLKNPGMSHYIADARVTDLDSVMEPHVVIRSWQDQWEANQVTFDGLINHQGKRKRTYYTLAARWAELPQQDVPGSISILRPAVPLYPGEKVTFYAKRFEKGVWRDPATVENEDYEWFLVKLGYFGAPIALKSMGTGSSLQLEIPKDYAFYRLMLTYQKKDTDQPAISVQKTLNLPLYAPE